MSNNTTKIEQTTIDKLTGEVLDYRETRFTKKQDNYYQIFLNKIDIILSLENKSCYKLFFIILRHTSYGSDYYNILFISSSIKEDAVINGISKSNFYKLIGIMCNNDLLRKVHRGKYMINPNVFFNGAYKNRSKAIEYFESLM